ncbi:MAG: hypothetical protein SGPRY_008954 [Prymnesium sp.]
MPLTTWTQLEADTTVGEREIVVKECNGWQPDDAIAIAPTSRRWDPMFGVSEEFSIAYVEPGEGVCTIGLSGALQAVHLGSSQFENFKPQAEVLNLRRSVVITGPTYARADPEPEVAGSTGFQGIATIQYAPGSMQLWHTRVEKCGRVKEKCYCTHFHLANNCPDCKLIGNAIVDGNNKGVTVHGTHSTLLQDNVVYNIKGAGIYYENGQEMNTTARGNAVGCPRVLECRCKDCVADQRDSDFLEQTGIYTLTCKDRASGRVCTKMLPAGIFRGNVFHNNNGFGWYVLRGFPLNVRQLPVTAGSPPGSEGGFVYDWGSCSPVQPTNGLDNAAPYKVEDHVEYNHDFGAGAYDYGDVTFVNLITAWSVKGMYWKTYHRGPRSGPLCDGCALFQTPELPGGDGLVEYRNSAFLNGAGVRINHHCNVNGLVTGGLCASHYLFTGPSLPKHIFSEAEGQTSALVTFGGMTRYLLGDGGANVAFDASACVEEPNSSQEWVACPDDYQLRVIKIYSPDRGSLTVTSNGVSVTVPWRNGGMPEGPSSYYETLVLPFCSGRPPTDCVNYMWPEGYTFVVRGGSSVEVSIGRELDLSEPKADLWYVDYGHSGWEGEDVATIQLSVSGAEDSE